MTLRFADGHTVSYRIVGEDETGPEQRRIGWSMPVAAALLGDEVGEERQLPRGVARGTGHRYWQLEVRRSRSSRAEPKRTFEPSGGSFPSAFFMQLDDRITIAVAAP